MVRWETSFEEETLGLDAAREEARTRLALGMGVAYRTDKRKRREDGALREPRKSPTRSTTWSTAGAPHGAPNGAPREPRKEHLLLRRTLGVRKA